MLGPTSSSMLELALPNRNGAPLKVLCLGAHSDDIEIGCGGTILKLARTHRNTFFYWVVFGADEPERAREAARSASLFLQGVRRKKVVIKGFRTSFFPYSGEEIKGCFEELKAEFSPHLTFTHCRQDLHQDHRLICELTWNTFRHHLILEYEIPKYDGDLGNPNFFVHLDAASVRRKTRYLLKTFRTQRSKHWFGADTFQGLLRIRGVESAAPGKYAEAFYCRKAVFR